MDIHTGRRLTCLLACLLAQNEQRTQACHAFICMYGWAPDVTHAREQLAALVAIGARVVLLAGQGWQTSADEKVPFTQAVQLGPPVPSGQPAG